MAAKLVSYHTRNSTPTLCLKLVNSLKVIHIFAELADPGHRAVCGSRQGQAEAEARPGPGPGGGRPAGPGEVRGGAEAHKAETGQQD